MRFTHKLKRDYDAAVGEYLASHYVDGGISLTDAELARVKLNVGVEFVAQHQTKANAMWLWFFIQHWASGREVMIQ